MTLLHTGHMSSVALAIVAHHHHVSSVALAWPLYKWHFYTQVTWAVLLWLDPFTHDTFTHRWLIMLELTPCLFPPITWAVALLHMAYTFPNFFCAAGSQWTARFSSLPNELQESLALLHILILLHITQDTFTHVCNYKYDGLAAAYTVYKRPSNKQQVHHCEIIFVSNKNLQPLLQVYCIEYHLNTSTWSQINTRSRFYRKYSPQPGTLWPYNQSVELQDLRPFN